MKADQLISRAAFRVNDTDRVRWTDGFWLEALNDAMGQVAELDHDANRLTEPTNLDEGVRQTLPERGVAVIAVPANVEQENGEDVPGRKIRVVDGVSLSALLPSWRKEEPATEIREIAVDPDRPREFFCFPPAKDGARVELVYAARPEPMSNKDGEVPLRDKYVPALVDYMVAQALAIDTGGASIQRADRYMNAFYVRMGINPGGDGGGER